jgi:PAS domain S-box-containing protein
MAFANGSIRTTAATLAGTAICLVLPAMGIFVVTALLPQFQAENLPLHAVVESLGGLLALSIVVILLVRRLRRPYERRFVWMSNAFVAMGVFDLFHAASSPGNNFVWLHILSSVAGGLLSALVWLPARRIPSERAWLSLIVTFGMSLATGIFSSLFPTWQPAMLSSGQFTRTAWATSVLGGCGFALASGRFVLRFHRAWRLDDWLFAVMTQLFAGAALMFPLTVLWDGGWWWWHFLRMLAFLAGGAFAVATYLRTETHLTALNHRLAGLNRDLDRTVSERTAELRATQERFALAVRGSSDGLWDWNVLSDEVYYSLRFKELLGHTDDDMENTFAAFECRLHPDDRQATLDAIRAHLQQRAPYDVQYRLRTKGGNYGWFRARGQAIWDERGRATRMAGAISDVTDRVRTLQALQAAKEGAEAANRAKTDFLANMSHEIRTPLNAVIGMTELVLDTELTDLQREYLTMVMESGEVLLATINEILDLAKIEAGKVQLEHVEFSLRDLLGDLMKSLAVRAHRKGLELAYDVEANVPDSLVGDVNRLRQIVLNLITNAIKFTEHGEVVVRVSCVFHDPNRVTLHTEVTDTGIGIPAAKQVTIFDAFTQADSSTTRRYGGTGLGLTICTRLVALMEGQIRVESEVGQGSTFSFTVNLGIADHEAKPSDRVELSELRGLPVLIVDDNATNRKILEEVLRHWGLAPHAVAGADEGLRLMRERSHTNEAIRLVLTDVNMPDVDGFTLCERIRNTPDLADTIIVVLTSGDRSDDVHRCRELRVSSYLLKPVKPSELLTVLQTVLGETAESWKAARRRRAISLSAKSSLRILVVEDSLMNQKLAVALLTKWGHCARLAVDGYQALKILAEEPFDLVLMDVQMPGMNGLETTVEIRRREQVTGERVAIVATTAHALPGDREQCLAAGMDGYLAKPLRQQELFETIRSLAPAIQT